MSTEKQINHSDSMSYEYFLVRAFQFNKNLRRPSNQEFLNLIEAENGNRHSWLPKLDKQLDEIKKRLEKAILIFISKSSDESQIDILENLQNEVTEINSSKDISRIVKKGLDVTQSFRK